MLLRIAGINHLDVLGREKLQQWLANHVGEQPAPIFVATEWDQAIFEQVRGQRGRFRQSAAGRWPQFSDDMLNTIELSLGYEGDSHLSKYPNLSVLWLDQGREIDQDDVDRFADDRLARYAELVGNNVDHANERQLLVTMSRLADERFPGEGGVGKRDRVFADRIVNQAQGNVWAFAVVGKRHAANVDGSMRRLVEQRGHVCQVSLL